MAEISYRSVRIDAVHYCQREAELAEKRKHRFFERNADVRDAPRQRLALFARTVRARDDLGRRVLSLKMAYMTREGSKPDLARTVSVLPNLRYVDLPEGFFADDSNCLPLRHELQARCPALRKMKYTAGSEAAFGLLASRRSWQMLEVLELSHLNVEPAMLVLGLASLPVLHELRMSQMPWLDDTIFDSLPTLPAFPPLQTLSLEGTPNLTRSGLVGYLSRPETSEGFDSLSLLNTGIVPSALHEILARAPHLRYLSIIETVSRSFPAADQRGSAVPLLRSPSLLTFHYEITSSTSTSPHSIQQPSTSHYTYLAHSLHGNGLPALRELYVRDADFPEMLVLEPPRPSFASSPNIGHRENYAARGFNQPLAVYSKGLDELEWNFTHVSPPVGPGHRGSFLPQRPISAYKLLEGGGLPSPGHGYGPAGGFGFGFGASSGNGGGYPHHHRTGSDYLSPPPIISASGGDGEGGGDNRLSLPPGWSLGSNHAGGGSGSGGQPRKSILVGNGFGGFLAVPASEHDGGGGSRPGSSGGWSTSATTAAGTDNHNHHNKKSGHVSRHDLWR